MKNFSINNSLVQKLRIGLTIPKNCTYLSTMQEFVSFYQIALYLTMAASVIEPFCIREIQRLCKSLFFCKESSKLKIQRKDFKNFEINSD